MIKVAILKILVPAIICCSASTFLFAQGNPVLETDPPPAMAPRTLVKQVGAARADYDKYSDQTFSTTRAVTLFKSEAGWGYVTAGFVSKGKSVLNPESVVVRVFIAAKDRTYVDNRKTKLAIDGKSVFDGTATLADGRTNGSEIYSSLTMTITRGDFERIASGQALSLQIGPSTWIVGKDDLAGFRDLLKLTLDS